MRLIVCAVASIIVAAPLCRWIVGFHRHFDAIVVMRQPGRTGMPVAGSGLRSTGLYVPIAACVASCRGSLLRLFRANGCSRGVFASAGSRFSPPPLVALISCCVRHCWGVAAAAAAAAHGTRRARAPMRRSKPVNTRQHPRRGRCYRCTP
jgi:hypothetical protein